MSEQHAPLPEPQIIEELTYKQQLEQMGQFGQNTRDRYGLGVEESTGRWVKVPEAGAATPEQALASVESKAESAEQTIKTAGDDLKKRVRRATRAQGPAATANNEAAHEDIEAIVVADTVEEVIADGKAAHADAGEILEAVDAVEAMPAEVAKAQQLGAGETVSDEDSYKQHAARIKAKIIQSEGAQQAFAEGGEEAFIKYVEEQFATNRGLNALAERLGYYEHAGRSKKTAIEVSPDSDGQKMLDHAERKQLTTGEVISSSEELQELEQQLDIARDAYVKLTAQRRRVSMFSRKASDDSLQEAREAYEAARNQAGAKAAELMREAGLDDAAIKEMAITGAIAEIHKLEGDIAQERIEISENVKFKRFYDWWARQGGGEKFFSKQRMSGLIKKSAVMGAPGLVAGAALGAALGPITGAAIGVVIARSVARGLAGAKINKEVNAAQVATAQEMKNLDRHYDALEDAVNTDSDLEADVVTQTVERATSSEVRRNRMRVAGSVALGAALGVAGAEAGKLARDFFDKTPAPKVPAKPNPVAPPKPVAPRNIVLDVPKGKGFEDTLQRQFGLTDAQAHDAYERAIHPFAEAQQGTYDKGTDIRIRRPGKFNLTSQESQALRSYLKSIGK